MSEKLKRYVVAPIVIIFIIFILAMCNKAEAAEVRLLEEDAVFPEGSDIYVTIYCDECYEFDTVARLYVDVENGVFNGIYAAGDFFTATPNVLIGPGWGAATIGIGMAVIDPIRDDWPRSGELITIGITPILLDTPITVEINREMEIDLDFIDQPPIPNSPSIQTFIPDTGNQVDYIWWDNFECGQTENLICYGDTAEGVALQGACEWESDLSITYLDIPDVTLLEGDVYFWRVQGFNGIDFTC